MSAADLPDGSVVASTHEALIKNRLGKTDEWCSTDGHEYSNVAVDLWLTRGTVQVLRNGYGKEDA